jgi:hypothetical protein
MLMRDLLKKMNNMRATATLKEYLKEKTPVVGREFTYVHPDTGFPAKVSFIEIVTDKIVKVKRLDDYYKPNYPIWDVEIEDCHITV